MFAHIKKIVLLDAPMAFQLCTTLLNSPDQTISETICSVLSLLAIYFLTEIVSRGSVVADVGSSSAFY